jgi:hypothetical protein
LHRRRFLAATVEAIAGVSLTGWGSAIRAVSGQLAPDAGGFAVIDTHTHFYDPTRAQGVPWPPRDEKLLYRTVMPKNYRVQPVPRPVAGTMVVEASPWLAPVYELAQVFPRKSCSHKHLCMGHTMP